MDINLNKKSGFVIFCIIIIISGVIVFLMGCDKQGSSNNNALNSIGIDNVKSDVLAVIINNPSPDKLNTITDLKTFEFDKTSMESILIIPANNKMNIEIKTLVFENNNLKEDKTIYKEENTADGFGLLLKASRPEGIPALKIFIDDNDMSGEYILQYNGKDGTPDIEYIVKKID